MERQDFNKFLSDCIEEYENYNGQIKYVDVKWGNLIDQNISLLLNEKGEFNNNFVKEIYKTIDTANSINEEQKEDLKKYFKFQAYYKAFDHVKGTIIEEITKLKKLKSDNVEQNKIIDKEIEEKSKMFFSFCNYDEFEEEDKSIFLISGLRAMSTTDSEYRKKIYRNY